MENSTSALKKTLSVNRLIRQDEFMELLSIKKTTFHEWVKKGIIPKPIRYSARLTLWDLSKKIWGSIKPLKISKEKQ